MIQRFNFHPALRVHASESATSRFVQLYQPFMGIPVRSFSGNLRLYTLRAPYEQNHGCRNLLPASGLPLRAVARLQDAGDSQDSRRKTEPHCSRTPNSRRQAGPVRALETAAQYLLAGRKPESQDDGRVRGGRAVFQSRAADFARDWPGTHCLPLGPGAIFASMYRIMQSPSVVALLFNVIGDGGGLDDYRQIFLDGRALPRNPDPTWRGYSVGHWDGDTLVVETVGFNDRSWLDGWGHPHSEKLRVIERFRRVDFGHMDFQITFDDPETLTRPLTLTVPVEYQPDTMILEYVCENERDAPHLARADQSVKLSAETLAKYAGAYDYTSGRPPSAPKLPPWLTTITVRMAGGRLYQGPFPLNATSETTFDSVSGTLEFSLDSAGLVNALTASGGLKYVRKR